MNKVLPFRELEENYSLTQYPKIEFCSKRVMLNKGKLPQISVRAKTKPIISITIISHIIEIRTNVIRQKEKRLKQG